jgi:hypothetical protein
MIRRLLFATVLFAAIAVPLVASAHHPEGPFDSTGGHECTQAEADAGTCLPAGSYHCHKLGCAIPSGKVQTTTGGPTIEELQAEVEAAQGGASASPLATAAPTVATAPPTNAVTTTAPSLGNTGGITDVLGWTGLAVLFLGVSFMLFAGPRRRGAHPDG